MKKLLLVAVIVAAAAAGYLLRQKLVMSEQDEAVAAVNDADVSQAIVSFTLPDLEGTRRDFSEWQGKARIVNFWATWCAPCRREIPLLKETQALYGEDGVQVIGIAVDFTEDVIAYAEEADFNYPVLVGQEDAMAVAESSGVQFIGLPFTLIVAPGGELLAAHLGEIHAPQLEAIVAELDRLATGRTNLDDARAALKSL